MATYVFTINGTTRECKSGSLSIDATTDGVTVLSAEIVSIDASVRPTLDQPVVLTEKGTPIYGGYIHTAQEMGAGNLPIVPIVTRISCVDFSDYANRIHPNLTLAAGTLKSQLVALQPYRTPFGATLDAGQANGPTMPALVYAYEKTLAEIYADLAVLSGYIPLTSASNVFKMIAPGDVACPFNITSGDGNTVGDIQVEPTRDDQYANRVVVPGQAQLQPAREDTFNGDGTTVLFELGAHASGPEAFTGGVWIDDGMGSGVVFETLGASGATWIWDLAASPQTITDMGPPSPYRVFPLPVGGTARIIYAGTFSGTAIAEDVPAQAAPTYIWEVVLPRTDVFDQAVLQAYADAELARRLVQQQIVTYDTYTLGAVPGQTQSIVETERNLNATYLLKSVRTSDPGRKDGALLRSVTAIANPLLRTSARNTVQQWSQSGEAAPAAQIASGDGPAPPFRSMQFNRAGVFGGTADALIDEDGSGETYGVEVLPFMAALGSRDSRGGQLAVFNDVIGKANALTLWQKDDGNIYLEFDATGITAGAAFNLLTYGPKGDIILGSARFTGISDGGYGSITGGLGYVGLRHLIGMDALLPGAVRKTSSFTIDAAYSGGGSPEAVIYLDKTTSATVTLPTTTDDTIAVGASDQYNRILFLKNINSGVWALTPASGTIDGASSYSLSQNQAVIIGSSVGTGAGWHILASFGTASDLVQVATVTLTNAQVIALPSTTYAIGPTPPSGYLINPLAVTWKKTAASGAWTGISAVYATLQLQTATSGVWVSDIIANDNSLTTDLTRLTDFLGGANNRLVRVACPYNEPVQASASGDVGYNAPVVTASPTDHDGLGVVIGLDNNGSPTALGGGNAGNSLKVTMYYTIEPV
jgi:hypothetical protein